MEQYIQQSSFKKHLNIILIKLKLAFKRDLEYKINLWMMLFENIWIIATYSLFYSTYNSFTKEIIPWNKIDFILLLFFILLFGQLVFTFAIFKFQHYLLAGGLNKSLVRPVNPFFDTIGITTRGATIIIFPIILIITLIIIYLNNYTNYWLVFLSFGLGSIYYFLFISVIYSLAFFFKYAGRVAEDIRKTIYKVDEYTPKMFESTPIKHIFFLLPSSIAAYFSVEILKGKTTQFISYLPIVVILILVFTILLYLIWHFGLKRYEAYN